MITSSTDYFGRICPETFNSDYTFRNRSVLGWDQSPLVWKWLISTSSVYPGILKLVPNTLLISSRGWWLLSGLIRIDRQDPEGTSRDHAAHTPQAELKPSRYLKPLTNFKLRPSEKLCKDLPWVGDSISLCLSAVMSFPLCGYDNPHCPVLERRTTRLSSKYPVRHLPSRKQTKSRLTEHMSKVYWCGRFFSETHLDV